MNSQKETGRGLKGVIRTLRNRGVLFAAASGRSKSSILSYFDDMPVTVIANNGGAVYLEDGTLLFTGEFPYEKARPVMELPVSLLHASGPDRRKRHLCQMDEPEEHKIFADFYFNKKVRFVPSWSRYFDRSIVKISISTGANRQNENRGMKFMQQFADSFSLVLSGDGWVDLTRKGISKGYGLEQVCRHYEIAMEETIVFGDYLNDLDMLRLRRTVMPWPMHIRK